MSSSFFPARASSKKAARSGRRLAMAPTFEALETRTLLSVTADNTAGTLTLTGDGDSEAIEVRQGENPGDIVVSAPGINTGGEGDPNEATFMGVNNITINSNGGDDRIEIDEDLLDTMSAIIDVQVDAGEGDDTIIGGSGDDSLVGGEGNDRIIDRAGNNTIDGGEGNNHIETGDGNDVIIVGAGNDHVVAGDGDNDVFDTGGNNRISAGEGDDTISTGAGNDRINAGDGDNNVDSGDGNDRVQTGDGHDDIATGAGNDNVRSGDGNDTIITADGNDNIRSGDGNDSIHAGDGRDNVRSGDGDDTVVGAEDKDKLRGGRGNDDLDGGEGNDTLRGGRGNDTLFGGDGRDRNRGGRGNNQIEDVRDRRPSEIEPNDTTVEAQDNPFALGITGELCFRGIVGGENDPADIFAVEIDETGILFIDVESRNNQPVTVEILASNGATVLATIVVDPETGDDEADDELEIFVAGTYFVRVTTPAEGRARYKVELDLDEGDGV